MKIDQLKTSMNSCKPYLISTMNGAVNMSLLLLHSTRWNSQFVLIAFFLLPKWRDNWKLFAVSLQLHGRRPGVPISTIERMLLSTVTELECFKAVTCFSTHWNKQSSALDVPCSDIVVLVSTASESSDFMALYKLLFNFYLPFICFTISCTYKLLSKRLRLLSMLSDIASAH